MSDTTYTETELRERLTRLAREGRTSDPAVGLVAAADGRLWDIDTGRDGEDAVLDADTAEDALAEVRVFLGLDALPAHWTARRVVLAGGAS